MNMSLNVKHLSESLQKKTEEELNEVPSRIRDDLQHIREWITQQPHFTVRTDDQWLLNVLRGCKFSLERTKEKLDMYCTMRTLLPEFYSNRDPFLPEIQEILKLGFCLPLPNTKDSAAPRAILIRCGPADPSKIQIANVIKVCFMIFDILLNEDDNFVIAGQEGFADLKELTMAHMAQVTPSLCKKTIMCVLKSYPVRLKVAFCGNSPLVEILYNMLKPLIPKKIKSRIHFYNDSSMHDIYKIISQSVLPNDYGGDGGNMDDITLYWKKKVESYREWFLEDEKYRSNESLRLGPSYKADELFGVEGSFRKLTID